MATLLERNVSSIADRLLLLAPPQSSVPSSFSEYAVDSRKHEAYLRQMQQLRGRVYLDDGALRREHLTADGRHRTPERRSQLALAVAAQPAR